MEGDNGTTNLTTDEKLLVADPTTGLLDDEFVDKLRSGMDTYHLSSSVSTDDNYEDRCRYLSSDVQFESATELVAESMRYIHADSDSVIVTAVMIYESMENLDELQPTTPFLMGLRPELLTSDEEEQTWASELKKMCPLEL